MKAHMVRDAFALLRLENERPRATLSAEAERIIRRRVARRWTERVAGVLAVAGLGAFALAGATETPADAPSPTPSIAAGADLATFPLSGGPEFVPASARYRCGDKAPESRPADHHYALSLEADDDALDAGWAEWLPDGVPVVGRLTLTAAANPGVVSTSGIDYLVLKDGIVAGMLDGQGPALDLKFGTPTRGTPFIAPVASWVHCPGTTQANGSGVEPGSYEMVAVARVFATPESVALAHVFANGLSPWNLNPLALHDDPEAVYLPGSWDCAQAISRLEPPRACLSDVSPQAVVDVPSRTVSLLYDTANLVEPFDTMLVSEPLAVELVEPAPDGAGDTPVAGSPGVFDDLGDFTCGAQGHIAFASDTRYEVESTLRSTALGLTEFGGELTGSVFARGAPDGSLVELMPGARLIFLRQSPVDALEGDLAVDSAAGQGARVATVDTVVGVASVTLPEGVVPNRFEGPQPVTFDASLSTPCPNRGSPLALREGHIAVVGTWRITTPGGSVTLVDSAWDTGSF